MIPETRVGSASIAMLDSAPMRALAVAIAGVSALVVSGVSALVAASQTPTEKGRLGLPLLEIVKPWTGDLDGMVQRRMLRVLTTYSRTLYFIDRGAPKGTAYDQGKLLEEELNKKVAGPL